MVGSLISQNFYQQAKKLLGKTENLNKINTNFKDYLSILENKELEENSEEKYLPKMKKNAKINENISPFKLIWKKSFAQQATGESLYGFYFHSKPIYDKQNSRVLFNYASKFFSAPHLFIDAHNGDFLPVDKRFSLLSDHGSSLSDVPNILFNNNKFSMHFHEKIENFVIFATKKNILSLNLIETVFKGLNYSSCVIHDNFYFKNIEKLLILGKISSNCFQNFFVLCVDIKLIDSYFSSNENWENNFDFSKFVVSKYFFFSDDETNTSFKQNGVCVYLDINFSYHSVFYNNLENKYFIYFYLFSFIFIFILFLFFYFYLFLFILILVFIYFYLFLFLFLFYFFILF